MVWDALFKRRSRRKEKPQDEMDRVVLAIEKFAPREHLSQREVFFYNYKITAPYPKPLFALLQTVSQRERLADDPPEFCGEIFLKLKAFYDPRGRLSLEESETDTGLKRKFKDVFVFFYGRQSPPVEVRDLPIFRKGGH